MNAWLLPHAQKAFHLLIFAISRLWAVTMSSAGRASELWPTPSQRGVTVLPAVR